MDDGIAFGQCADGFDDGFSFDGTRDAALLSIGMVFIPADVLCRTLGGDIHRILLGPRNRLDRAVEIQSPCVELLLQVLILAERRDAAWIPSVDNLMTGNRIFVGISGSPDEDRDDVRTLQRDVIGNQFFGISGMMRLLDEHLALLRRSEFTPEQNAFVGFILSRNGTLEIADLTEASTHLADLIRHFYPTRQVAEPGGNLVSAYRIRLVSGLADNERPSRTHEVRRTLGGRVQSVLDGLINEALERIRTREAVGHADLM